MLNIGQGVSASMQAGLHAIICTSCSATPESRSLIPDVAANPVRTGATHAHYSHTHTLVEHASTCTTSLATRTSSDVSQSAHPCRLSTHGARDASAHAAVTTTKTHTRTRQSSCVVYSNNHPLNYDAGMSAFRRSVGSSSASTRRAFSFFFARQSLAMCPRSPQSKHRPR